VDLGDLYGAAAGWVEARTSCPHLGTMPPAADVDLARVPPPDSPCSRLVSTVQFREQQGLRQSNYKCRIRGF
jgi:hypothetical protein